MKHLFSCHEYRGYWKDNLRNGRGLEITLEGEFNGEWFNNMRHGKVKKNNNYT